MSKLLPFTAIIVTTGNDGCLLYHTVQVNVTHPSTIMFSEEVLELLTNPATAEIAAVISGHVQTLSSRIFKPSENEDTEYEQDPITNTEKVEAWHIVCPTKVSLLFTHPHVPEIVHKGSIDFDYIFSEYDSYADLDEAEPDLALSLVELSEYMEEHKMIAMGISFGYLSQILSHPSVNFDVLESSYEETTGPCFPEEDGDYYTDAPHEDAERGTVYVFSDADRQRWEEEDQLAQYQGEGWHGQ